MNFHRHEAASRVSECFQTLTVKINKAGKQPVVAPVNPPQLDADPRPPRRSAPGVPELLRPLLRPPLLRRKLGPPRARQTCRYHVSDTRIIYIELITCI